MKKYTRLLNLIANLLIGLVGIYILDWDAAQVFFFIYITNLLFIPFEIITYTNIQPNKKKSLGGFIGIYAVVFLLFSLFYNLLLQTTGSNYNDFFHVFKTEFKLLFSDYGLALLGIILFYTAQQIYLQKKVDWEKSDESGYLMHIILKFFIPVPILIVIAVTLQNINDMPFDEELLVLSTYVAYESFKPKLKTKGVSLKTK